MGTRIMKINASSQDWEVIRCCCWSVLLNPGCTLESPESSVKQVKVNSELETCSCLNPSGERLSNSNFTADIAKFLYSYINQSLNFDSDSSNH